MTQSIIPEAWKKTIIVPLVRIMFDGAGGDLDAAWEHAVQLIQAHEPKTEQELRMFVRMTILNAQANQSIAKSVDQGTPRPQAIRLRANGLAAMKAADKAEQRFNQLQTARKQRAKKPAQASENAPAPENAPEKAPEPPKVAEATPNPKNIREEAGIIKDYARKNNISYAEAWGLYQREKKTVQAAQPAAT